jgi:hypothetical protein
MAKQPTTYKSPEPVYVDGIYHNANTPFTTAAEPNDNWEKLSGGEKAAMEASDKTLDVQPPLEELGIEALRALAATKNVPATVDGKPLSKKDLITAIKAADEPAL